MELGYLLRVLRSDLRLIVSGLFLGLAVAAALTWSATPWYQSSTRLFVSMDSAAVADPADTEAARQVDLFGQERVDTYVRLLMSDELAARVADDLRLDLTPAQVADKVTAASVRGTVLLEATVTDTSAERARDIAGSLGDHVAAWVSGPQAPDGATGSLVKVTVVEAPQLDRDPVLPNPSQDLQLGAVVGLLLGLGLSQVRSRRSAVGVGPPDDVHPLDRDGHIRGLRRLLSPRAAVTRGRSYTADANRRLMPR